MSLMPRLFTRARGSRSRCLLCVLALAVTSASLQAADELRVFPLVREQHVLVSFELSDGFTPEMRDAIRSGLKTTFTYTVDLRLQVPMWVDRTIDTAVVSNSVEYDNLTRRYNVVRSINGRVEKTEVTEDEALVKEWMTSFSRLPLFDTERLLPNRDYYVRVVATARPSNGSILWPWGSGTSGQAKFTFVR